MKLVISILMLMGTFSLQAAASDDSSDMSFLKNYESKIKTLENYQVTYLEAGQVKPDHGSTNVGTGITVKLIPAAKRKS